MVVTEDIEETVRIGKIDFSVRISEEDPDAQARRRRRQVEAITRWLLAEWRVEQGRPTH